MRVVPHPPPGFDAEGFARAAAPALGLPVPDAEVPEVAANLARIAGFAALIGEVPGLDATEPAPVFCAAAQAGEAGP